MLSRARFHVFQVAPLNFLDQRLTHTGTLWVRVEMAVRKVKLTFVDDREITSGAQGGRWNISANLSSSFNYREDIMRSKRMRFDSRENVIRCDGFRLTHSMILAKA